MGSKTMFRHQDVNLVRTTFWDVIAYWKGGNLVEGRSPRCPSWNICISLGETNGQAVGCQGRTCSFHPHCLPREKTVFLATPHLTITGQCFHILEAGKEYPAWLPPKET
jgi:hypothetical protein